MIRYILRNKQPHLISQQEHTGSTYPDKTGRVEQSLIGIEIVERIADREGIDPVDLDVPLFEAIDPDALEALTNATGDRQPQTNSRVEFSYSGFAVTVDGSGSEHRRAAN